LATARNPLSYFGTLKLVEMRRVKQTMEEAPHIPVLGIMYVHTTLSEANKSILSSERTDECVDD